MGCLAFHHHSHWFPAAFRAMIAALNPWHTLTNAATPSIYCDFVSCLPWSLLPSISPALLQKCKMWISHTTVSRQSAKNQLQWRSKWMAAPDKNRHDVGRAVDHADLLLVAVITNPPIFNSQSNHALAFENQISVSRHQVPLSGDFKSHVLGFESPTFPRLNSHIKAPFNRCIHGSFLHLLALRGLRYWGGSLDSWLHLSQVKLGTESAVVGVYRTF